MPALSVPVVDLSIDLSILVSAGFLSIVPAGLSAGGVVVDWAHTGPAANTPTTATATTLFHACICFSPLCGFGSVEVWVTESRAELNSPDGVRARPCRALRRRRPARRRA